MTLPASAAPRLTRLELHGFKSFATRTVFTFEPGITAIIGPNGSGKSNVSDAVRWVLGEQSHGALRSKKTEDVIFAGGHGRAPLGMAEVTVVFDNSTGWLPSEFTEVAVTRRAFRGGENQYLINGRRVRLKDVALLTASLGQSHTVVGQGLVDAALSQRAEERRALFEHAADLTGLRLKVAEAERSLAETEANAARLTDLLAELEPRLKTLERAARQAREWHGLHDRLRELQRAHYRVLWRAATERVAEAARAAAGDEAALAAARSEVERLAGELTAARQAADAARSALGRHQARLAEIVERARRAGHERDLTAERHGALVRRREDMADTQAGLEEQAATVARELAAVSAARAACDADVAAARRTVERMQAEGAAAREARNERERRAAELGRAVAEGERRLADLARRRALLEQRRETDAAERERAARAAAERAARIARLAEELAAFDAAEQAAAAELEAFEGRLTELARAGEAAAETFRSAREAVADVERHLGQATTRLEVLQRLHESGTGLYAGVRETLRAARTGKLGGVRGTVAELIEVPAAYETAIEVALGGHLQDVVVERWADAEAAILHLKRGGAGRATFQPLDTVRGQGAGRGPRSLPEPALARPGVEGVAADLVTAAPELGAVVTALLGRTLVVADLPAARAALPHLPPGWSAVTLAGEIARTGGSVTGGAAVRESGVLGRERELRELPQEIRRLDRAREQALAAQQAAAETPRRLAAERQDVEAARAGALAARKERQGQRVRLAGWLADLQQEQTAGERRLAALVEGSASAARDLATLDRDAAAATEALDAARAEQAAIDAELRREAEATQAFERNLAAEGRRLATLEERLQGDRRREAALRAQERAVADELALRGERAAALDRELAALAEQHERLARAVEGLAAQREATQTERPPLETAARAAEAEVARRERELEAARVALLESERGHGARGLDLERARGELATVRQRIVDDLELEDPDALLPGEPNPTDAAGDDAEREIARLKERLRRVGYVGENVVEEYDREAAHHAFLREQLADVQGAAAALRGLLGDLQVQMRERFERTFARVAAAFGETFTALFGGGTARLLLVEPEEGETSAGIDIVAQPPGKRLQSLALLSGGERALTAVALLFAILRVNPTPFCLLDEVDAALDEANVVRFREELRLLAAETQAIVITHNRGTIEIADTLYGVTMRDDGVSQVLSLRLTEVADGVSG